MPVGKLIKINTQKKLVMKIDKPTYDNLLTRMRLLAKKLDHSDSRLAVWSFVDDFGETQYRLNVKLDKYDIQNMRKFEALLRFDVSIAGSLKPYAFFPEGAHEQICGINYELVSIRKLVKARPITHEVLEAALDEEAAKAEVRVLSTDTTLSPLENDIC